VAVNTKKNNRVEKKYSGKIQNCLHRTTTVIVAESADEEKSSILLVWPKISTNEKQAGILPIIPYPS